MLEINKIYQGNCLQVMNKIDNNTIDLIITSPPYNIGKNYNKVSDSLEKKEYIQLIDKTIKQFSRILKEDGRFCINYGDFIPCLGIYGPLFISEICKKYDLKIKYNITWIKTTTNKYLPIFGKQSFCGCNTAWGSYLSASNPSIRSHSEVIIVGYKNQFNKKEKGVSDITKNEFLEYTQNVWYFKQEINNQKIHSCPFPSELPYRCIKLFSYQKDLVLDPFLGIGTTCLTARKLKRNFIGIELDSSYFKLSNEKLKQQELL